MEFKIGNYRISIERVIPQSPFALSRREQRELAHRVEIEASGYATGSQLMRRGKAVRDLTRRGGIFISLSEALDWVEATFEGPSV